MSNARNLADIIGAAGIPVVTSNASFSANVAVTGAATFSNTVAVTGNATFSNTTSHTGIATFSSNVVLGTTTISANGGVGTSGQVLTSGATGNAYWSTVATTLDSVLGSGNTTTKSLTTGALTVNGEFTTTTNTATVGTNLYGVANGNVGVGTATPTSKLDVFSATANEVRSVSSNNASYANFIVDVNNRVNDRVQLTNFGNTASGTLVGINRANAGFLVKSNGDLGIGTRDTAGSLVFGTNEIERTRIDSNGYTMLKTKKIGMGTQTGNGKEVQTLSWSGSVTNATTDLLTTTNFGENGHAGMFLLNVMYAGKGVSRIYFLTGRYAQCTLTMYQGGTRGAGEDAYLQLTGGSNSIGLQLVTSGWSVPVVYYVAAFLGISTAHYDNWFSN